MRNFLRSLSYFRDDLPLIGAQIGLLVLSMLFRVLQPLPWALMLDLVLVPTDKVAWFHKLFFFSSPPKTP